MTRAWLVGSPTDLVIVDFVGRRLRRVAVDRAHDRKCGGASNTESDDHPSSKANGTFLGSSGFGHSWNGRDVPVRNPAFAGWRRRRPWSGTAPNARSINQKLVQEEKRGAEVGKVESGGILAAGNLEDRRSTQHRDRDGQDRYD